MSEITVSTRALQETARAMRENDERSRTIPTANMTVTVEQLETAARLTREADPTVITHENGRRVDRAEERPAYLLPAPGIPVGTILLQIGILPSASHRITPDGHVL